MCVSGDNNSIMCIWMDDSDEVDSLDVEKTDSEADNARETGKKCEKMKES